MAGPGCSTDVTRAIPAPRPRRRAKNLGGDQEAGIVMLGLRFSWELF